MSTAIDFKFYPKSTNGLLFLAFITLLLIALPTVLEVGVGAMKDYDGSKIEVYIAFGADIQTTAKDYVIPAIKGSLNSAIALAACRVIVELHIALRLVKDYHHVGNTAPLEAFRLIFESISIEDSWQVVVFLLLASSMIRLFIPGLLTSRVPA